MFQSLHLTYCLDDVVPRLLIEAVDDDYVARSMKRSGSMVLRSWHS